MKYNSLLLWGFIILFSGCTANMHHTPDIDEQEKIHQEALRLYQSGAYQASLNLFEQILDKDPHIKEVHYNKGLAYFALGQYHQALASFDEALMIDVGYKDALTKKGETFRELGYFSQAIDIFALLLKQYPDDKNTLLDEGITRYRMEEYELALEDYDKALKQDPNFVDVLVNKAILLSAQGKRTQALQLLEKASKIETGNAFIYYNQASIFSDIAYEKTQNGKDANIELKKSLNLFDKAGDIAPEDLDIPMAKAITLFRMGNYPQSLKIVEYVLQRNPEYKQAQIYKQKIEKMLQKYRKSH